MRTKEITVDEVGIVSMSPGGKPVYGYIVHNVSSLREAMDHIPGDFKVYWWNQDRETFRVEIVVTF